MLAVAEVVAVVVAVVASVAVVVVEEVVCSNAPPRLSDGVGADGVGVDEEEQPGLFTETHASPVAETAPTGVSAPADTNVVVCAETGTGAVTSAVSVAVVFVTVVFRSVWLETVGLLSVAWVAVVMGSESCDVLSETPVWV